MLHVLQGMRLERMWADLKLYWNKFHSSKNGFVADDCQPNSAFSALSDQTCLATFLGVRSEDNELVKVLKALMMLQVNALLRTSLLYLSLFSPVGFLIKYILLLLIMCAVL